MTEFNLTPEQKELVENYIEYSKKMEEENNALKINVHSLNNENKRLFNQISEFEDKSYELRYCINCAKNFSPVNNFDVLLILN